ncbi:MAG: glycosyltransferase family 2 protein [Armatimonadota bacterium]
MFTNTENIKSDILEKNSKSITDISIVIPLYNEEDNLEPLYREITENLRKMNRTYEIIFVNDGSTDGSIAILEELCIVDPLVKVIHLRRNFGKAVALSAGFKEAHGNIIITMDGDLQDNPVEIPRFVAGIETGYDLVSGWKYVRHDPLSKTLPSKLFNKVVSSATGLSLHDFNCGFKAYSKDLIDKLQIYGELHRYIPALAYGNGFRVTEIKVDHRPRKHGKSKYGWERYTRGLLDLLTVIFITKYTKKPLHLFGSAGLLFMGIGFVINAYLAIIWLMGQPIGHRPLLNLGVLLMVLGVQFVSTGLLGEMLTHSQKHDEESYISRRINNPGNGV